MPSDFNPVHLKKANARLNKLLYPTHTLTEAIEEAIDIPAVIPWWKRILRVLGF